LPVSRLPAIAAEMARVTEGHFIATVRAIGSTPTIYVDPLDKARHFKQDHSRDRCDIELRDGRHIAFNSHLFTASELRNLINDRLDVEELRGLDVFHSRFAPDPRWNPASLPANHQRYDELMRLEKAYA